VKRCYARPLPTNRRKQRGRVEHATEIRADDLWDTISAALRDTLTATTYETLVRQAEHGRSPTVGSSSRFRTTSPRVVEGHFLDLVSRAAADALVTRPS